MKFKIDVKIRKQVKELFDREVAHRKSILMLSLAAEQANRELWDIIIKTHPKFKMHMLKQCNFQPLTWEVTVNESNPLNN